MQAIMRNLVHTTDEKRRKKLQRSMRRKKSRFSKSVQQSEIIHKTDSFPLRMKIKIKIPSDEKT